MDNERKKRGWAEAELPQPRTKPPAAQPAHRAARPATQPARGAARPAAELGRPARPQAGQPPVRRRKKKKRRARPMGRTNLRVKLLTMAAVVAAIILGFVIFFKVQHIEVLGNKYYTAQEVAAVCGVSAGDNLLTVRKASIVAAVQENLPYISEVQVKRSLPDKLVILVSEYEVSYGIEDSSGIWWLFNRAGRILEQTTEQAAKSGHVVVTGLTIAPPVPGEELEPAGAGEPQELAAKKKAVLELLQLLEERPLVKKIVSLDVTASYDVTLWYGTQYQIRFGIPESFKEKLTFLEVVLEELEDDNLEGVIDVTFSEDKNVRFQPFRQN